MTTSTTRMLSFVLPTPDTRVLPRQVVSPPIRLSVHDLFQLFTTLPSCPRTPLYAVPLKWITPNDPPGDLLHRKYDTHSVTSYLVFDVSFPDRRRVWWNVSNSTPRIRSVEEKDPDTSLSGMEVVGKVFVRERFSNI